jgi:hypothetical protein
VPMDDSSSPPEDPNRKAEWWRRIRQLLPDAIVISSALLDLVAMADRRLLGRLLSGPCPSGYALDSTIVHVLQIHYRKL